MFWSYSTGYMWHIVSLLTTVYKHIPVEDATESKLFNLAAKYNDIQWSYFKVKIDKFKTEK